ncbi:hypothetical protein B0O99DRAFT_733815 [Bisporella sp. PMI_857]|nr:hypothetical protein B0O99DRAFT_733815 [Bisporella sp. PMI_857]
MDPLLVGVFALLIELSVAQLYFMIRVSQLLSEERASQSPPLRAITRAPPEVRAPPTPPAGARAPPTLPAGERAPPREIMTSLPTELIRVQLEKHKLPAEFHSANPIDSCISPIIGFFAVFLSDAVLREFNFHVETPGGWFEPSSILVQLQPKFLGISDALRDKMRSCATKALEAKRDHVLQRIGEAVSDKEALVEEYHLLRLYLLIGKKVAAYKWDGNSRAPRGEGTFGCDKRCFATWVMDRKNEPRLLGIHKSDLAHGLWDLKDLGEIESTPDTDSTADAKFEELCSKAGYVKV